MVRGSLCSVAADISLEIAAARRANVLHLLRGTNVAGPRGRPQEPHMCGELNSGQPRRKRGANKFAPTAQSEGFPLIPHFFLEKPRNKWVTVQSRLFGLCVELVDDSLQVVELLAGFREFALGSEALVVGEVSARLRGKALRICGRSGAGGVC